MTVVYLEPVGTGESGRLADPRDYTLATYTHLLHAVIEHLGLAEVALLGHSHGGFVAQRYALDHPERLASLVLYDTSPMTGEEFWAAAVANMESFVQRHADERPEVATYVAGLTTRLDRSDDEGATKVLRAISPAYFHDYWGREEEFAAGGHLCGCSRHRPGGRAPVRRPRGTAPAHRPDPGPGRRGRLHLRAALGAHDPPAPSRRPAGDPARDRPSRAHRASREVHGGRARLPQRMTVRASLSPMRKCHRRGSASWEPRSRTASRTTCS